MAAVHYNPLPDAARIEDPVSYKEASALLADTGHPASSQTIARWVREANQLTEVIPVMRSGKTDYVSWTLVMREHKQRTAAKLRASAAW